ncbi:MAG: GGDEF domain-containing protein [Gammaproteobacteria bacterium]|nr:GGDEF domain-containing protein [Gammaproteobacteria bacterium]MDH5593957.1 GGDEF domain-containing protein [Gammaproteobacteria bacterium]
MGNISVVTRISLGLVLMTISILLIADITGILPNENKAVLESRKKTCETLALQLSLYAENNKTREMQTLVRAIVERNDDILSAAMRRYYSKDDSKLIVATSEHEKLWIPPEDGKSTPTHAQIPIFKGNGQWGAVELLFTPINSSGFLGLDINPVYKLLAFVALFGFLGYMFFMRRTLKHLDPTAIIPSRVKYALDALSEGIILMDQNGRIVLANNTFTENAGKEETELMGKKPSDWGWKKPHTDELIETYPWMESINTKEIHTGIPMAFSKQGHDEKIFMVNSSPILGADGKIKGAIATFDDVTQLEEKNTQLETTLQLLELSYDEINKKNNELQILASHDPLTGCLNRRAFFEKFESDLARAKRSHSNICCIMTDIDHFKNVNDTYGHAEGDKILIEVSNKLKESLRKGDMLCRYGGEEFCFMLWDTNLDEAAEIADRIRLSITTITNCQTRVTSSFGVSSRIFGAKTPEELINQADEALYIAKENGRNRVIRWDDFTKTSHVSGSDAAER